MAGKWKKRLKKIGKIAAGAGALALAIKLGKGRGMKGNVSKAAAMEGITGRGPRVDDYNYIPGKRKWDLGPVDPGAPSAAKGGRITKKHGGRTRKQFGGGLNRPVGGPVAGPVARPIGGVGAGVGAGVRAPVRPLGYKKGGHVKSMGIAKRGGGVAKK